MDDSGLPSSYQVDLMAKVLTQKLSSECAEVRYLVFM